MTEEETQKELNTPLHDDNGLDPKDKEFLEMLVRMISEGKIDLLKPDTLINHAVYDGLSEEIQGKADLEAVNMLAAIRDIKGLYESGNTETYQMANLVERLRLTKERLEEAHDLFVI